MCVCVCVCVCVRGGHRSSQVVLVVRNLPANAGDMKHAGLIPELGRSPGEGHSNPLQYSCQENPVDRGAWWAMVHRVTKSRARLKQLSMHRSTCQAHMCNKSPGSLDAQVMLAVFRPAGRQVYTLQAGPAFSWKGHPVSFSIGAWK